MASGRTAGAVPAREHTYRDGDTTLRGLILLPTGTAVVPRPGVVVFHDAMGVGSHAVATAEALAESGFAVFVADLYGERVSPGDTARAMELMGGLRADSGKWRARAAAALDVLESLPGVDPARLAAIGHCFGGSTALELLRHGTPLQAVVCFHGILATGQRALTGASDCSVLVCTGADDPLVPPEQVVEFLDEMRQAGIDCQTLVHSGARHAFTMPSADSLGRPAMGYHPRAARRSWAAMEALFADAFSLATPP